MAGILAPRNAGEIEQRERFEQRIEAARPALEKRARMYLPASDVDDAVQETLTRALTKMEWRDILFPEHWVLGIMDFVIRALTGPAGHYGQKTRPALLGDVDYNPATDPCEIVMEEIAAAQLMTAQIEAIRDAMPRAGLTPKEWDVLEKRLIGKTNAEIGAGLTIEPNAVRSYLSNAIKKMRPLLCAAPFWAHL